MIKTEFNNLTVLEQINHVNSLLKDGQSLNTIADNLNLSKTTIRSRAEKIGYMFNSDLKAYTSVKDGVIQIPPKDETKPLAKQDDTRNAIADKTLTTSQINPINVSNNNNGNMGGNKSNSIVINKTVNKDKPRRVSYYLNVSTIKDVERLAKQSNKGISHFLQELLDTILDNIEIK